MKTFFFLFFFSSLNFEEIIPLSLENDDILPEGRILDESIVFKNEKSLTDETQAMRDFYQQIMDEHEKDSESIIITTSQNANNSQTTGNEDEIQDIELLLPSYDIPMQDPEQEQNVLDHHEFLDNMIDVLSPDFFNEDPKMFLGDYDAYFKIVKKRSILFFYVS